MTDLRPRIISEARVADRWSTGQRARCARVVRSCSAGLSSDSSPTP
jgi:hypothetical protein